MKLSFLVISFLSLFLLFHSMVFAQDQVSAFSIDKVEKIVKNSATYLQGQESCEEVLLNHIKVVDESESFIHELTHKSTYEITQYEITMLQKILTNRFAHLNKALSAFKESDEVSGCYPSILGQAIAVYDFALLGNSVFGDIELRRIVFNFTKHAKYSLQSLRKMYARFTSSEFLEEFKQNMEDLKEVLPESVEASSHLKTGRFRTLPDVLLRGSISFVSGVAKVWGFISDKLIWRNGRLNGDQEALGELRANLKPLDLIFEKRNFTLSNYTIPGHWGHVAIWLGTKEQLIENGMWNKDFFQPFKQAVEEGKNIIEIRKKGIQFVSLEKFINLDEIAVTRIKNASVQAEEIFQNLVDQMDAAYDFSFNAQTPDKLTCSELVAYTYGNIRWPEYKTILQVSLRPDDVAILSLYDETPEEFVLYLKGNRNAPFEKKGFEDWKELFTKKVLKLNKQFEKKLNAIRSRNIK
ncbi:MAG: hypothetical protein KBD76_03500 [Bacteriovorax sp.]|nr:hypothetical protein [Bacteriovorax sp.]